MQVPLCFIAYFVHEGGKHGFLQNSKNRTTLPSGWFNGVKGHAGAA